MSLINEALKKAQRQRSLDSAPLSSAPSGVAAAAVTTHVAAATRRRRGLAPLWFGLGVLILGATATALIMRYGLAPAATPASVVASTPPAPAPVAVTATPVAPEAPPQIILPSLAASAPLAQAPAPAAVTVTQPTPTAPASTRTTPTSPPTLASPPLSAPAPVAVAVIAPPPTPAEIPARAYAFLSEARLTGVRGVDAQARVLMNERVFRLNDIVSPELGLRISAVRPGLLVFTDAQGRTYEKPY